jgi:uncharacterized membrane protein
MRQFRNVMRSRAVPILSGAVLVVLVVPATALATGFAGPNVGVHHPAATSSGGSGGSEGLVIFLAVIAVIAVAVLFVALLSRAETERKSSRRPATSIHRNRAGIAS